ncbi:MAG TPA: hypothetical protein VEL76_24730, partial [Gemmataceae bacterium]|nr:hypothetical protein [Gemmataceae bacterium]
TRKLGQGLIDEKRDIHDFCGPLDEKRDIHDFCGPLTAKIMNVPFLFRFTAHLGAHRERLSRSKGGGVR